MANRRRVFRDLISGAIFQTDNDDKWYMKVESGYDEDGSECVYNIVNMNDGFLLIMENLDAEVDEKTGMVEVYPRPEPEDNVAK